MASPARPGPTQAIYGFTGGEWKKNEGNKQPIICVDGDKDWPIVVTVSGHSPEGIEANIRLICASQELLYSLHDLVHSPNAKKNAMWDRARAALKKVRK